MAQIAYNGTAFDTDLQAARISHVARMNPRGYRDSTRARWGIKGLLIRQEAETQAELLDKIAALKSTFSVNGGDLYLNLNDGTETPHQILTGDTIGGVRVLGLRFPNEKDILSVFRTYEIDLEADLIDHEGEIVSFHESVRFFGGGPRVVWAEAQTGLPQKQMAAQRTVFRCIQAGSAVGFTTYPDLPGPINGSALDREVTPYFGRPQEMRGEFRYYPVSWIYSMSSDTPLGGVPTTGV